MLKIESLSIVMHKMHNLNLGWKSGFHFVPLVSHKL